MIERISERVSMMKSTNMRFISPQRLKLRARLLTPNRLEHTVDDNNFPDRKVCSEELKQVFENIKRRKCRKQSKKANSEKTVLKISLKKQILATKCRISKRSRIAAIKDLRTSVFSPTRMKKDICIMPK